MVDKKKHLISSEALNDVGFITAFRQGNTVTKLSAIVFGLGNIVNKQIIKGLIFLALEVAYIYYMVTFGMNAFKNFFTLGTVVQQEVFNEAKQIYEYVPGDNSMLSLLYGVITIFVTIVFLCICASSIRSAYITQIRKENGRPLNDFLDDLHSLLESNVHKLLLAIPIVGVLAFTIIPLVFMILMAFTSYDREHQPPGQLFGWVGLENFIEMFEFGGKLSRTFWPVLSWTLIWAVVATITCYVFGILLALLINRDGTRLKSMWRFFFVLSIAVPQFVSLLTMRTMFNTNGPVNVLLRELNIIGITESVPFFLDANIAKITIICINVWIGVPFSMLTATGILQNIPRDLYEAAKVDGANPFVTFAKITMPYMLFVTTPNLITSFVGNINNFNVIFLLSGGGPDKIGSHYAGSTDLLVTWLYKLTIVNKDYNIGAVIGIIVFVILATFSLITYRHTGSYKDEEAFQ